jgi:hypothetical protein
MTEIENGSAPAASEVDYTALPIGASIGRFRITAVLGQGGFGITYRARDEQLGRDVAIKEYLPVSLAVRQDSVTVLPRSTKVAEDFGWGRERFVAEGRTLASLHDAPAIVRVFDFLELNGTAYIVMELVRGETLEAHVKQRGQLGPTEVDAILWPLLDGLEQVHKAGFLHRDIKPANILLRADGKPTLIDFGASRAAMAGRTTAMTAVFTPGYAAPEQMTAAKQGPWTDIYGLSATLYHAISGQAPPSAFDRMLDDEYQPLAKLAPAGFARGLLVGLDAGLAVRASDRPQSIAGWRPILGQAAGVADDATVALVRPESAPPVRPTVVPAQPAPTAEPEATASAPAAAPPRKRTALYVAAGAAVALLLGAVGAVMMNDKPSPQAVALQDMKVEELEKALQARRKADAEAAEKKRAEEEAQRQATADADAKRKADDDLKQAEQQRQKAEAELARLREELDAQRKATAEQRELADTQAKRAAVEEARRKAEAEMAALKAAEDEARRKVEIEAEAKRLADEALAKAQAERAAAEQAARQTAAEEARRKAEADARTRADAEARAREQAEKEKVEAQAKAQAEADARAAEQGLRLAPIDRQRLQVALTALGFNTGGNDGTFGQRTRQMIANWQKSRNEPETGYLNAAQQQALLRDATAAVARFDDDQKKAEEEKKRKAEEEAKAKAAPAAPAPPSPATVVPPAQTAAVAPAPSVAANPHDGRWSGMVNLPSGSQPLSVTLRNGTGKGSWRNARCGGDVVYTVSIQPDGRFQVTIEGYDNGCAPNTGSQAGMLQNNTLRFSFLRGQATFSLSK